MSIYMSDLISLGMVVSGVIGGLIAWYLRNWAFYRDVNQLSAQYARIENTLRGQIGNTRKAEQTERESEAIGQFLGVIMNKEIPPEEKMQHLQALGLKYGDVALKYLKKAS